MTDTKQSAIAAAISAAITERDRMVETECWQTRIEDVEPAMIRAAILAYLGALVEDEGAVEAVARELAPRVWEVLDYEKDRMLRKYAGQNVAYPADQHQDKVSMTQARIVLRTLATRAQGESS